MEAKENLRALVIALLVVVAIGAWWMRPAKRHTFTVTQKQLDQGKTTVNEMDYARPDEHGPLTTRDEEKEHAKEMAAEAAEPEPEAVTPEMKAQGRLPLGDPRIR